MIQRDIIQKKFRVFIWLSLFVLLMEVAGGVITNSLALFSDAGHVLIDLLALLLAYFAMRLARRGTTEQFTYGYYRAEILAAMANAIVLFLLTILIAAILYAQGERAAGLVIRFVRRLDGERGKQ